MWKTSKKEKVEDKFLVIKKMSQFSSQNYILNVFLNELKHRKALHNDNFTKTIVCLAVKTEQENENSSA